MSQILHSAFESLCRRYSSDEDKIQTLWTELERAYSSKSRYYHNLTHLEHLHTQLTPCRELIADADAVALALFYHDFVYKVTSKRNEERSAAECYNRMVTLNVKVETVFTTSTMILATKAHAESSSVDVNLFTDADLSILGCEPDQYLKYTRNIRKEYRLYPDLVYRPGRRKVVQHFINMRRIFKTDYFYNRLEQQARFNLQSELTTLG